MYCFYIFIDFHKVHKEPITSIPNSVNGRGDIEIEIYGMEGIPEKDLDEKRKQGKIRRGELSNITKERKSKVNYQI